MIEFFNSIMGLEALLAKWETLIMRCCTADLRTHFTCVRAKRSAPILFEIVIKETPFWIMLGLILVEKWARLAFEFGQIQKNENIITTFLLPWEIRWIVWYSQVLAIRPIGLPTSSRSVLLLQVTPLSISKLVSTTIMNQSCIDRRRLTHVAHISNTGWEIYLLNIIWKMICIDRTFPICQILISLMHIRDQILSSWILIGIFKLSQILIELFRLLLFISMIDFIFLYENRNCLILIFVARGFND